jgi:signal transduction histidine kinase
MPYPMKILKNRIVKSVVVVIFIMGQQNICAQTPEIEKLKTELKTSSGISKVDKLIKLGLLQVSFNQKEGLNTFLTAEKEAEGLKYIKGEASAKRFIGQCYAIQLNFTKAEKYYLESLSRYKTINSNADVADLMFNLAQLHFTSKNDYKKNRMEVDSLIAFCKTSNQTSALISAYIVSGNVEYAAYHNNEAIADYFKAVKLADSNEKHINKKALAYSEIASLYNDLGDYENAYNYQLKSVEIYRKSNWPDLTISLINLGQTLDGAGKKEDAAEYYREALEQSYELRNQHYTALSSENLARNLYDRKKYKESLTYALQSLEIYRSFKNTPKIASALTLAAKSNYELNQYSNAKKYVIEGLSIPENHKVRADLFLLHSKIMEKEHNDSEALKSFKRYVTLQDSLQKIDDKQNKEDVLIKYDTKYKEYQNQLLSKDVKIKQLQLSSQNKAITYLIIGIVLLTLLLFMVYKLFSSKRKTNRILAEQKKELAITNNQLSEAIRTKDKFFSILSHDLRDPVISMQSFGKMMAHKYELMTEEERRELIEDNIRSSTSLSNLLEELLVWARCQTGSIYPVYERFNLQKLLSEICTSYQSIAGQKDIALELTCDVSGKVSTDRSMLSTIMRNLISNAIKFSYLHQKIEIFCDADERSLSISVKDGGTGMTEDDLNNLFSITTSFSKEGTAEEKGSGLGLIICNDFVSALGGELLVKSQKEKGSVFTIKLPTNINVALNT